MGVGGVVAEAFVEEGCGVHLYWIEKCLGCHFLTLD